MLKNSSHYTHSHQYIVVKAQESRSQHENLAIAMKRLEKQLWAKQQRESAEKDQQVREQSGVGLGNASWADHIRQYVLHPKAYVKDMRTGKVIEGNHAVDKVFDKHNI